MASGSLTTVPTCPVHHCALNIEFVDDRIRRAFCPLCQHPASVECPTCNGTGRVAPTMTVGGSSERKNTSRQGDE